MCHKKKGHHFGCTCNSLCKIQMDEMYNDNAYTFQIQIVLHVYCNLCYAARAKSSCMCHMQLIFNYIFQLQKPKFLIVKARSWLRCGLFKGHLQFGVECDVVQYENKIGRTKGIHSLNILGENSSKGVQKPSQKDHLLINVTCIGMPTWRN
jgi:hypothetical protein